MYKYVLVYILIITGAKAQTIYPYRTCLAPQELKEFSGIAKIDENKLAAINDGGNSTEIYFLDTLGKITQRVALSGVKNTDWEELFADKENLYVADVGDNLGQRKHINWYAYNFKTKQVSPSSNFTLNGKKEAATRAQRFYDCEAGFVYNQHVYLFSKSHANPYKGKTYQYKIPLVKQLATVQKYDSTNFGNNGFLYNSLTGASINASKKIVAFISCTHVWFSINFPDDKFFKGYHIDFSFEGLTQKEAITFTGEHTFVVADERSALILGGRMYFFDVLPYLNGTKRYQKPMVQQALVKKNSANQLLGEFTLQTKSKKLQLCTVDTKGNVLEKFELVKNGNKVSVKVKPKSATQCKGYWLTSNDTIIFTGRING